MVVIQENNTYFVSSRLHLPHGAGTEESTATFCQINYVNIKGVKWKLKYAIYLKFLYIRDGVLLVRYGWNWWSQFVGVVIAKWSCATNTVSNCFTLKLAPKTYSWHRTPQYSAAVGAIVIFSWHYLIAKSFGKEWKVSQWFTFSFGHKECYWSVQGLLTL